PRPRSDERFTPRLGDAVEPATGRTERRHRPAHDPGGDGTGAHPVFHALGEPLQATRLGRRPRSVLGLEELDEVQDLVELLVGKCFELPPETLAHDVVHGPRLRAAPARRDRKSTRLNSSHVKISYAVSCLKKKNTCNESHK